MTKRRKVTRASLWTSALSLLLCVAMLAGATFSWFSDTVTSGKNKILAGNLDVELEYSKDFYTWNTVEAASDLFVQDTLWEPNHTEVVYLKVTNKGTLALDWKALVYAAAETKGTNVNDTEFSLADYLKFGISETNAAYADRAAAQAAVTAPFTLGNYPASGEALKAGESKTYGLVVYMPYTVGNEANYKTDTTPPSIDLGLRLEATQATYEQDSFGDQYDAGANGDPDNKSFGSVPTAVVTAAETVTDDNGNNVTVARLTQSTDVSASGTVAGQTMSVSANVPEGTLLDENTTALSINVSEQTNPTSGIDVQLGQTAQTLNIEIVGLNDTYNKKVIDVKATGFTSAPVKVYHNTDVMIKVDSEIATPSTGDADKYWYDSDNKTLHLYIKATSPFTFISADEDTGIYQDTADTNKWHIKNAKGLTAFATAVKGGNDFAGKTVVLDEDIDLNNTAWTPIGTKENYFKGTFDGSDNTIKNLNVNLPSQDYVGLFGYTETPVVLKNITIQNATVVGQQCVAAVVGCNYTGAVEGCKVTGTIKIQGNYKVAAITGYSYHDVKNCTVEATANSGSYIKGVYAKDDLEADNIGGIVGYFAESNYTISDCSVKNISIEGTRKVGGIAGSIQAGHVCTNCNVANISVVSNATNTYAGEKKIFVGGIIGESIANSTLTNCKVENATITGKNADQAGAIVGGSRAENAVITITDTTYTNTTVYPGVVAIGNTQYATLADAVVKVPTNNTQTTIKLMGNVSGSGVKVQDGQNIVFDLNGYNYDVTDTVGSAGTETNGFQLLKGATVTFKNGSLTSSTAKLLLQNYCNLTLDNVKLDESTHSNILYVVSNNHGSLTTKNGTVIKAAAGKCAFDLWYGMYTSYEDGVSVTIGKGTVLDGKVEYGSSTSVTDWTSKTVLTIDPTVDLTKVTFAKGSTYDVTPNAKYGTEQIVFASNN